MRQDYSYEMIQLCHKVQVKMWYYETSKDSAKHKNPKHLKASNFHSSVQFFEIHCFLVLERQFLIVFISYYR